MASSTLSRIKDVIFKPLRIFRSYIRKQLVFAMSIFIGMLFILLALAEFIMEAFPSISEWIVFLVIGILVLVAGYIFRES